MSLTDKNQKEKELLKTIAKNNKENDNNSEVITNAHSYYIPSTQRTDLLLYSFSTIVELRKTLLKLWENDNKMREFIPVVLASVFKNSPQSAADSLPPIESMGGDDSKEILPVYTYTL